MTRRINIAFTLVLFALSMSLTACHQDSAKVENASAEEATSQYQCPMKCSTEISDKPGKCSVCGMDTEKLIAK